MLNEGSFELQMREDSWWMNRISLANAFFIVHRTKSLAGERALTKPGWYLPTYSNAIELDIGDTDAYYCPITYDLVVNQAIPPEGNECKAIET